MKKLKKKILKSIVKVVEGTGDKHALPSESPILFYQPKRIKNKGSKTIEYDIKFN